MRKKKGFQDFLREEDGMGTVEVILIIVVLVGLVILFKSQKGYLTVFLTLILTVMLSFSMTLIVSAGENTRRFAAECVTDIGMNSILAEYHRELLEQYNVFFTDISYGTQVIAYENMTEHLKNYINHNLQGDDLFMQGVYGNLIHMELDNIAVNGALSACEEGGISLRRQAEEAYCALYGRRETVCDAEFSEAYFFSELQKCGTPQQAAFALLRLHGYSIAEIAARYKLDPRRVRRMLKSLYSAYLRFRGNGKAATK